MELRFFVRHSIVAFIGVSLLLCPTLVMAQNYKVFKGSEFSFRYPTNWEEGLSQLSTTQALVRATSSRTGYSASCNINVSFVAGLDQFTQAQINKVNYKLHDFEYLSRLENMFPDMKIIDYSTNTYLSMQPASSIEFLATLRGHNVSQLNRFFQIMTIRKPNRYVVTCRGVPENFSKAKESIDLILASFIIFNNLGIP